MTANSRNNECPNCGAPLQLRHFVLYCNFCGHVETVAGLDAIGQIDSDTTALCYEYIAHNASFIRKSGIVHFDMLPDKTYRLWTHRPFFPNNGRWERINDLAINIVYTNDTVEDHLFFSVRFNGTANTLSPYFAVLLNDEYVVQAKFIDSAESSFFFEVEVVEFTLVCMAANVEISTNLIDLPMADFREFKTYCCRFYNQVFDRTKYSYSLNTRLITDNF